MLGISKSYKLLILFCFGLALSGTALTINSSLSCAQSTAGCATDTWTAMANRAAMETRREDVMNKRYIVKADSVLQYSCFIDELVNVVDNTSRIFSNGDAFANRTVELIQPDGGIGGLLTGGIGGITDLLGGNNGEVEIQIYEQNTAYEAGYIIDGTVLGPDSIELALQDVVTAPLENYLLGNFDHIVLSGTTNLSNISLCYNMANVWQAAKCKNFSGTAEFYSFENLTDIPNFITSDDPREFPPSMECQL